MSNVGPTNFGSCWSCITDLTSPSTMATGFAAVAQAVARRWQTPRGGLVDDPNYGFDLTDLINDDINQSDLAGMQRQAAAEAEKDERVLSCKVSISVVSNGLMNVIGTIQTASGPFRLVVSVSNVSVTLLQVTPQ